MGILLRVFVLVAAAALLIAGGALAHRSSSELDRVTDLATPAN